MTESGYMGAGFSRLSRRHTTACSKLAASCFGYGYTLYITRRHRSYLAVDLRATDNFVRPDMIDRNHN